MTDGRMGKSGEKREEGGVVIKDNRRDLYGVENVQDLEKWQSSTNVQWMHELT